MKVISSPQELIFFRKSLNQKTVGFVPTMGALHFGHQTLMEQARKENDLVVLSIFVNPTQFNNKEDLEKYPRTFESDLEIAKKAGVDVVFAPEYSQMYADNYRYTVSEKQLSPILCGAHRPGHFDGVLSVVLKLLNIVAPTHAYFGEKDYQQLLLIEDMVKALFIPTTIVHVPTVRESDGLAMSSRNTRLNAEDREKAPLIYKTLMSPQTIEEKKAFLEKNGFRVEYLEKHFGRLFIAAWLGSETNSVRLIDNVEA